MFKFILSLTLLISSPAFAKTKPTLNIFSSRHYDVDKIIYERFEQKQGVKLNVLEGKADILIKRLQNSQEAVDLFITTDVSKLTKLASKDMLQNLSNQLLLDLPSQNNNNKWLGFTKRSRVIISSPDIQPPESYESLASPIYQGLICVRSSSNSYNQSLVASLLGYYDKKQVANWLTSIVNNFARTPKGNDTAHIKAVANNVDGCKISLVNDYYIARMSASDDDKTKKYNQEKINVTYPNQSSRGVHANISGIALLKGAKNQI